MVDLIEREAVLAGETGSERIVMKLNNLVDERIVDALYLASGAGVQVELIVRGICALRPGVPNLSDNITVRSILGRFLEHSRVFYFHNQGEEDMYIGSADMMHRNLDRRVEALVRVKRPDTRARIEEILELALSDNCSSWSLSSDGNWQRIEPSDDQPRIDLQQELMRRASLHA
jgi:polyphosphate kinase